jgi:hypothetical protein
MDAVPKFEVESTPWTVAHVGFVAGPMDCTENSQNDVCMDDEDAVATAAAA